MPKGGPNRAWPGSGLVFGCLGSQSWVKSLLISITIIQKWLANLYYYYRYHCCGGCAQHTTLMPNYPLSYALQSRQCYTVLLITLLFPVETGQQ